MKVLPATRNLSEQRVATDEVALVHTMLRREFRLLPAAIRRVPPGDRCHTTVVGAHIRLVSTVLYAQLHSKEKRIWPRLTRRAPTGFAPLTEKIRHLIRQLDMVDVDLRWILAVWENSADRMSREELAAVVERLTELLIEYLDVERGEVIPLVAKHITQAEWAAMTAESQSSFSTRQRHVVLGATIYEGEPEAIARTVARAPEERRGRLRQIAEQAYADQALSVYGSSRPPRAGSVTLMTGPPAR